MKIKKLYKITIMKYLDTKPDRSFDLSRSIEVAAYDASQAIRKVKYNLTQKMEKLMPYEFIDEVTRLGTIEVT